MSDVQDILIKVWKILKEWYLHWKQWQELIEVQKRK